MAFGDDDIERLVKGLREHQRLVVTLNNHDAKGTTSLEFDVRGFAKAFEPLKRCRMPRAGGRR